MIDLTFTSLEVETQQTWVINGALSMYSDYEVIVFDRASLDDTVDGMKSS